MPSKRNGTHQGRAIAQNIYFEAETLMVLLNTINLSKTWKRPKTLQRPAKAK